jgi:predicted DNA binding CopG/RHH family protein
MASKSRLIAVHTERVTIALPSRLKRQVFDAAECQGVPASEFIRNAIETAAASPRAA